MGIYQVKFVVLEKKSFCSFFCCSLYGLVNWLFSSGLVRLKMTRCGDYMLWSLWDHFVEPPMRVMVRPSSELSLTMLNYFAHTVEPIKRSSSFDRKHITWLYNSLGIVLLKKLNFLIWTVLNVDKCPLIVMLIQRKFFTRWCFWTCWFNTC